VPEAAVGGDANDVELLSDPGAVHRDEVAPVSGRPLDVVERLPGVGIADGVPYASFLGLRVIGNSDDVKVSRYLCARDVHEAASFAGPRLDVSKWFPAAGMAHCMPQSSLGGRANDVEMAGPGSFVNPNLSTRAGGEGAAFAGGRFNIEERAPRTRIPNRTPHPPVGGDAHHVETHRPLSRTSRLRAVCQIGHERNLPPS
jgi:hypothetical protein